MQTQKPTLSLNVKSTSLNQVNNATVCVRVSPEDGETLFWFNQNTMGFADDIARISGAKIQIDFESISAVVSFEIPVSTTELEWRQSGHCWQPTERLIKRVNLLISHALGRTDQEDETDIKI